MNMPEQKEDGGLILQVLSYVGEQINFLRQEMNSRFDKVEDRFNEVNLIRNTKFNPHIV